MPFVEKRLRWFDDGAPLLRAAADQLGFGAALPVGEEWYACPLCLTVHPRTAVLAGTLTEEHVPPHVLGGHGLLLTCAACNNTAGTTLDAHAVRRRHLEDFFIHRRATGRTLPVTIHADGIPLRGTIQWTDDGSLQIFGVPRQNHPDQQAAHLQTLDDYVDRADPILNITFTIQAQYDANRDQLSWIPRRLPRRLRRTRLALHPATEHGPVPRSVPRTRHHHSARPVRATAPPPPISAASCSSTTRRPPRSRRHLRPTPHPAARHRPAADHPPAPRRDHRTQHRRRNHQADLHGKEVPWPRRPTYLLDHLPDAPNR